MMAAPRATMGHMSSAISSAAWAPTDEASLIASYTPFDLSTLWKESGRTTQVTADSDPVGAADDESSNSYHLLQTTSTRRLTYKTSGGLHSVENDNTDDYLTVNWSLISQPITIVIGLEFISTGANEILLDGDDVTDRNAIWLNASNELAGWAGSDLSSGITPTVGVKYTVSAVFNGGSSKIRVNGAETSGSIGTKGLSGINLLAHYNGSGLVSDAKCYGLMLFDEAMSDFTDAEAYMDGKMGI